MTDYRNRIVGYGTKPASQFLANPLNHRKHPQKQRAAMAASLKELGWVNVVIENVRTGALIDGHERIWQAMKADDAEVPYIQVDLAPEEEHLALAILDSITGMAEVDAAMLGELLRDVTTGEPALQELLASMAEEAGITSGGGDEVDAEPQIDKAEELRVKWGVETGQLWQLGEHRLLCGDSTKRDDVERVMGVEKAEMMFADPPYGVDYDGGHFHSGNVNIKRAREKLEGDETPEIYRKFLPVVIPFVDGPCYLWFAGSNGRVVFDSVEDVGCQIHSMLVWHKTNATYAAMNAQYKQRHEPCLYFKPNGSTLRWAGPSDASTLWEFNKEGVNKLHPTQKPTDLVVNAVCNHAAETVLDPFLGSGTTLIACEQLGRKCRAIEISPGYVAVALQRWADATGKEPKLLTS